MNCEWAGCPEPATHEVTVTLPEGAVHVWQVCAEHDKAVKVTTTRSRNLQPEQPPEVVAPAKTVHCGECDLPLDEADDLPVEDRTPCPVCGATKRTVKVSAADQLGALREEVRLEANRPGAGVLRRVRTGDSQTKDSGTWGTRTLDLDHEHDAYREEILLSDGTRIVSKARLRDHQGHG